MWDFTEIWPEIQAAIADATFISFDTEFSGLSLSDSNINGMDTIEERYYKLRQSVSEFLVMQFGLCTFQWNEESSKYTERAYNFHVFPRPFSRQAPDRRFLCQSSSMDFLANQEFDFNKVFKEGLSYLLPADEEKLRSALEEKHARSRDLRSSPAFTSPAAPGSVSSSVSKGPPEIPADKKEIIENICDKITEFLKTDEAELALPAFNGYLRKLIYQITEIRFPQSVVIETRTNEKKLRYQVVVRVSSPEEIQQREEQKRLQEHKEIDDAVGFTKVIKCLSESGKLLIGHNMLMDVLFMINQFLCTLPEDYHDFKLLVQSSFPKLSDTKLIALSEPFNEFVPVTMLSELYARLKEDPFKEHLPDIEFGEGHPDLFAGAEKLHDASYDAHLTGVCYATMLKHCNGNLNVHLNKLNLMRLFDIPYMNLGGNDVTPNRDHVFHVSFPVTWKHQDVQMLFSPFGTCSINWINDSSAYVALHKKENAPMVPRQLKSTELYQVLSYKWYHQRLVSAKQKLKAAAASLTSAANHNAAHKLVAKTANHIAGQKRKMPISDADVPEKRRHQEASSASSEKRKSVITPIPEETESPENSVSQDKTSSEDLGVPIKRAGTDAIPVPDVSPKSEDFEVPSAW